MSKSISSEWRFTTLGQISFIRRGASPRPIDSPKWFADIGPGWVRINDVTRSNGRLRATEQYLSPSGVAKSVSVKPGQLIMSICATIGEPAIVEIDVCIHDGFVVFDLYEKDLATEFLYHFLRYWTPKFKSCGQTGTQANLNTGIVGSTPILLPPLPEQQRIAEILDTMDEAIARTDALIQKLKQMKAGLLNDLLTRGIDDNGELRDPEKHPEQFKDSPLGRLPKEWEVKQLSELADVDRGKFTHRPRNDPRFYGGLYPFIQTSDITKTEGGVLTTYSQTLNEHGINVSKEFPCGTIAVTIAANIADTSILGIPMFFPDSVVGVVVKKPNNIRYVELTIRNAKQRLNAQAPQSAQKNINLEDLRPLLVAFSKPEEQSKIAEIYETHNTCIEKEQAYLSKLKQQKKGLMQDLLTGKVRVKI